MLDRQAGEEANNFSNFPEDRQPLKGTPSPAPSLLDEPIPNKNLSPPLAEEPPKEGNSLASLYPPLILPCLGLGPGLCSFQVRFEFETLFECPSDRSLRPLLLLLSCPCDFLVSKT